MRRFFSMREAVVWRSWCSASASSYAFRRDARAGTKRHDAFLIRGVVVLEHFRLPAPVRVAWSAALFLNLLALFPGGLLLPLALANCSRYSANCADARRMARRAADAAPSAIQPLIGEDGSPKAIETANSVDRPVDAWPRR